MTQQYCDAILNLLCLCDIYRARLCKNVLRMAVIFGVVPDILKSGSYTSVVCMTHFGVGHYSLTGSYTSVVCMTHFGVGHYSLGIIIQSIQKMRRIYKGKENIGIIFVRLGRLV